MSTAPFRIIATDHTGITVTNLERSLAFWRDVLGFELSHRPHQTGKLASEITGVPGAEISIAVLKGYGHKIELLEYLAPADHKHVNVRPCDVGSAHVAFTVDNLDAVLGAVAASDWKTAGKPQTSNRARTLGSASFMFAIPTGQQSSHAAAASKQLMVES
jgi:catechol 2,3-dioxygenase-like lactoylglutathione lyase family enzyme